MKIWTYEEMVNKVEMDLDLEDETFVKTDEMAGYFNEALSEAESEIMVTNQEYLLTKALVPVVQGTTDYDLPLNIYANKIRTIQYHNGAIINEIPQFRRMNKFLNIAISEQYPVYDQFYQYLLINDVPGQAQVRFLPTMQQTAIMYPYTSIFAPVQMWYIRNCARVPMLGELCNPEVIPSSQVTFGTDIIVSFSGTQKSLGPRKYGVVSQALPGSYPGSTKLITGDKVRLRAGPGSTLPAPLFEMTDYYVIQLNTQSSNGWQIKLAATKVGAMTGTAINLSSNGTGYFVMEVAATQAIRWATIIDIPEFATFIMQWVKCRCYEKEGDPRLENASKVLVQQKGQMVDTLTEAIIDDDTILQGDFSSYWEIS